MNSTRARLSPMTSALILLWLVGVCLRLTVLAVPPVLIYIRSELGLSGIELGILGSLPAGMFALAALGGSLLVARLGLRRTLITGLSMVAVGSACRGLGGGIGVLLAATALMGAGVAFLQPALPAAVRAWAPHRIGFATAIYTNGLLVSEVVPVVLTPIAVMPLLHSWRADLVLWSVPVAMITALVAQRAPRDGAGSGATSSTSRAAPAPAWWPDWSMGLIWRLALLFVGINSLYFGTNTFLPLVLSATGRAEWIGYALAALNFAQLPASLLLLAIAQRLERRSWPYFVCGALALAGVLAIVFGDGMMAVAGAGLIGFFDGGALILALTLPALLAPSDDVARTSAAVFTLSYAGAVAIGVLSGALWDATRVPAAAFIPLGASASSLVLGSLVMRLRGEMR